MALALPDADLQTAWLDMTADEKLLYDLHHCVEPGVSLRSVKKLEACSHVYDLEVHAASRLPSTLLCLQ